MQGVISTHAQLTPKVISNIAVNPRTLVYFIKMRQSFPFIQFLPFLVKHRRPIGIIKQSFSQITCWSEVLKPLLILYTNRITAKLIGEPQSGDVHLTLL